MSMPGRGVGIGRTHVAISSTDNPPQILIDPHELAPAMKKHFAAYVTRLNNPAEVELRKAFERRFNHDNMP